MKKLYLLIVIISTLGCKSDDIDPPIPQIYNVLSLGDSYTIGQGVCDTCGYPEQLIDSLT